MKLFNIYKHDAYNTYKAVKVGWSWPAFFFGWIWMIYHKMWKYLFSIYGSLFLIFIFLAAISEGVGTRAADNLYNFITGIVNIGLSVYLGVLGNSLLAKYLKGKGFYQVGQVYAENPDMAVYTLHQQNKQ